MELFLYLTELFEIELFWHLTVCKEKLYIYLTELFDSTKKVEIEVVLTIRLCTYDKLNCLK